MSIQLSLDKAAIGMSVLCAAHCLLVPVIVALAPNSMSFGLDGEAFHRLLIWGIIPTSILALVMGCRKHKRYQVFAYGTAGLLTLCLAAFLGHDQLGEVGEKALTVLGGILIAFGHLTNFRLCRSSECDGTSNKD